MTDNEKTGRHLLTEKDFVDVVDADGNPLPPVPKHWDDDQLAPGATKKSRRSGSSSSTPPPPDPNAEPAGNASTDAWVAYAKTAKGAQDADLLAEDGTTPLTRDELKAKFGSPS